MKILIYCSSFFYGLLIGSFLNVCIYRIPRKESIVWSRSHCMSCGYQLAWYDLIPLFSYIGLRGKCRKCHERISLQYPLIEALNGSLYLFIMVKNGFNFESILYCLATSALIVLSVIDFRTFEIPFGINFFLFLLGLLHMLSDLSHWSTYVIGFFSVSGFLAILYVITRGRGIGGGDIKLMAACGLLLGWKLIILALFAGSILGSIIHITRMKISKIEHMLAFGPYLSAGIFLAMLYGNEFWNWYLSFGNV